MGDSVSGPFRQHRQDITEPTKPPPGEEGSTGTSGRDVKEVWKATQQGDPHSVPLHRLPPAEAQALSLPWSKSPPLHSSTLPPPEVGEPMKAEQGQQVEMVPWRDRPSHQACCPGPSPTQPQPDPKSHPGLNFHPAASSVPLPCWATLGSSGGGCRALPQFQGYSCPGSLS